MASVDGEFMGTQAAQDFKGDEVRFNPKHITCLLVRPVMLFMEQKRFWYSGIGHIHEVKSLIQISAPKRAGDYSNRYLAEAARQFGHCLDLKILVVRLLDCDALRKPWPWHCLRGDTTGGWLNFSVNHENF